jgi:elongation factor G
MEKFLGGEEITNEEIVKAIRKATLAKYYCTCCCGTSFKNKGVQNLLDAVVAYLYAISC